MLARPLYATTSGGCARGTHGTPPAKSLVLGALVVGIDGVVTNRAMTVTFRREGRCCVWTALRPPRTRVPGPAMAAGGDLPHDLATFVIEDALDIEFGFWGCVAAGATFRSLRRRRTPQGSAVIAAHADDLDAAERRVNEVYVAWRRGDPTPCGPDLDEMLSRWKPLSTGEELVVEWATSRPRRRSVSWSC